MHRLILVLLLAPLCLGAAEEQGEEEGVLKPLVPQMVWAAATFLVVLFVLRKTAWPAITQALDDRADRIRESLAAAEEARRSAEEERVRTIAQLEAERQRMREEAAQAEAELARTKEEILNGARSQAAALRQKAEDAIERAKVRALSEIKETAVDLAMAGTETILKRRFSMEDDRRLAQDVIESLSRSG